MKIAIVGAGIAGVTTAYELARDGHHITVFEQRGAVAEEASFATGSLLAPLLSTPWTLPGFGQPLRLWGAQASLRLGGGMSLPHLAWLRRWRQASRRNTTPAATLEALARYSHARLEAIAALHDLDFEATTGRLLLLRTEAELAAIQPALQTLRDTGQTVHEITPEAAHKLEPGLCPETPLAAAIHLPAASAGNCRLFGQLLRQGIQGSAVTFDGPTGPGPASGGRTWLHRERTPARSHPRPCCQRDRRGAADQHHATGAAGAHCGRR
jgi:D-amino-acid dehydrogenase